jgi:hypothetical protein
VRAVYEAENLIDAHLVRGRLEQAGVRAWVRGDLLTGGMGGLPVHGLVSVWVEESELPAALAELEALRADRARGGAATDEGPVDLSLPSGRLA